jgi:hypothetical protein
VSDGRIFQCVNKTIAIWGESIAEKVNLAPDDLRRPCARFCDLAGGEREQIQFLPGHVSVEMTQNYLGCKRKLRIAVNDHIGI